ncbi:hypothetical protein ACFOZ1_09415 [Gracilibacillus marinus]|jgi:hypothetical protein|uniref:DUF308 domain-containing protein n=1 Tax=Gracilibacillus marinus TaxID=630535 RepID=A0ABV8VWE6_9BACI
MSGKEVTFKESRIIATTLLLVGMGFLMSVIPEGNLYLFLFNLFLAIIACVLFYTFWRKLKFQSKRYFSLLSYVMINTMAIYFAIPLLRLYFLTFTFWFGIGMLLIMIILPYLYAKEIAFGVQKPYKSKLGKIFLIYTVLVMVFGISAYMGSLYHANADALVLAVVAFLMSLLFFFLAPIMLIKPEEMDELMKK